MKKEGLTPLLNTPVYQVTLAKERGRSLYSRAVFKGGS